MGKRQWEWESDKRNGKETRGMGIKQGEWERDKGNENGKDTMGMGMVKIQDEWERE